jgi:hypothetical protein
VSQADDLEYYRHRAAVERKLAQAAPTKLIAETHAKLAQLYQAVIDGEDLGCAFPKPGEPIP